MTRSIFLPHESYADVQAALAKADTDLDRKRLIWERMKQNGCTQESETAFRHHCQVINFVLPDEAGKRNPLANDAGGRTQARLLRDAVKSAFRQDQILKTDRVEE